ncbi:type II toxin-antitoxin system RelE/ParE family toxin [Rhizobium sp. AAP43]|uniref:type II toxin-antitoxin system RelE/ParE family toxin n=1 Tax=Rhizobium sp. AAP43 TaxID=1523420 RepID=UPI000ADC4E7F|nr:type II toxin-antitoxin system RelE/ParE family toxin [Rhizobium sp. AAP43]
MRRRQLVLTKSALRDLRAHYDYVCAFDPGAAERLLHEINRKIRSIAELGVSGVPRTFSPGLRAFPFRNRCIYFTITDDTVTVLRVMHGRQNTTPDDFPESEP